MNSKVLICILMSLSLVNVFAAEPSEVRLLLGKAEQNLKQSVDKAVEYAGQALLLAQQLQMTREEATAQLYLAKGYSRAGANDKALERCQKALKAFQSAKDRRGEADALEHLGNIYWKLKDGTRVQEYYSQSLKIRKQLGDKKQLADALNNIGIVTLHYLNNPEKAMQYYRQALAMSKQAGYLSGQADALNDIGNYYHMKMEIDSSLAYNLQSLRLYRQIKDDNRITTNLLIVGFLYSLKKEFYKAEDYYQEALELSLRNGASSIRRDIYLSYLGLYDQTGDRDKYMEYTIKYYELDDSLSNTESNRNIANLQTQFAVEKKELENRILRLNVQKQRIFLAGLLAFITMGMVATLFIIKEKRKSEKLLLNILPRKVADELKKTGRTNPQTFTDVTVLFSDFAGFTELSSDLEPEELIGELSEIFTAFDQLAEENGCERIKTIGDAYLAVCGLPVTQASHARKMTQVALGMIEYLKQRNLNSGLQWNVRIGMHTGKVVGGIVGIKKYIYDVFGDTINTASRMESNSLPMEINITESLYVLIRDDFICEKRHETEVKGKGSMQMYFVKGKV